jgi:Uma2 family endonuclease
MKGIKKAELVEGVVYMASPVSIDEHSTIDNVVGGWLMCYRAATPGLKSGTNGTLKLDALNEFQPDQCLYILPEFGGQTAKKGRYLTGGPELVVEFSATSASIDLRRKKEVYLRHRVREYIVVRTYDSRIDWFERTGDEFVPIAHGADGVLRSRYFPGLWLHVEGLLADDAATVLKTLHLGLATPEHAAFVASLASRKS